jgi:hypothetical protein
MARGFRQIAQNALVEQSTRLTLKAQQMTQRGTPTTLFTEEKYAFSSS